MRFPGFIGPSYTLQSVNVDCQSCVNLFPEMDALGTGKEREVAALVPTPGLLRKVTLSEGPVRGIFRASNGSVFAVGGTKLNSISSSFVATEIGTLSTSSGAVSLADNGVSVFLVDGTYGYSCTVAGATFAQIIDPDFYASDLVTYQDGYFIFTKSGTQTFFISGINDVTIDPLDISTAEALPDYLIGGISGNQNLFLFGAQTTEVFYDSGNADFPFERIQGAVSGVGCSAVHTIAKMNGVPYWVGGNESGHGVVYRMNGYQPERISTPAIESVIRGVTLSSLSTSRAFTYEQGGHSFYCLSIPTTNTTWTYDASTGLWHERQYLNKWSLERHRGDCHAVAYGFNVVGDYVTGEIYSLDPDTYSDDGDAIARIRAAPHFSQDLNRVFHSSFQLDMETGVGLDGAVTTQGVDPQAVLQWSDDGGHTWSDERWTSIGAIGKTRTRVIWRRLGSSRDRVYRVMVTDPVKVVLIGAELGVEAGAA